MAAILCLRRNPPAMRFVLLLLALAYAASANAESFINDFETVWAETPKGRFECLKGAATDNLQVLKLNGRVLFEEKPGPNGIVEGKTLANGIRHENMGCPEVIGNENGYIVMARAVQPPQYGLTGYVLVDVNAKQPRLVALCTATRSKDEKIAKAQRFVWSATGVTLRYVGYRCDESENSPGAKPGPHEVRYEFASGAVQQLK